MRGLLACSPSILLIPARIPAGMRVSAPLYLMSEPLVYERVDGTEIKGTYFLASKSKKMKCHISRQ
jgi:hypothetical protein